MYSKKQLKLKDEAIVAGISRLFQTYSLISTNLKDLSLILKKILLMGIVYLIILGCLRKNIFILFVFMVIAIFLMMAYLIKNSAKTSYWNSKEIGGMKNGNIFNIIKNLSCITYNVQKMKKEEKRLVDQILTVNKLNNIECIKELRNYYAHYKLNKEMDVKKILRNILSLYIIPITLGIINIYTAIDWNLGLETDVINISYIIFGAAVIGTIIWIIYSILKIKQEVSANNYVAPRLENLLLEIMLEKLSKEGKKA